jgi:hypothetical protein
MSSMTALPEDRTRLGCAYFHSSTVREFVQQTAFICALLILCFRALGAA